MSKIQIIKACPDCMHYIHDDNDVQERWGLHWCLLENRECLELVIPKWCPLPDGEK